jgi:hypothetical protein
VEVKAGLNGDEFVVTRPGSALRDGRAARITRPGGA